VHCLHIADETRLPLNDELHGVVHLLFIHACLKLQP
jgi:hypothetical protein